MAARSKKPTIEKARFLREVQNLLRHLHVKQGYIVFAVYGPYDHNRDDLPLPMADLPQVFRSLSDAVDFAQTKKGYGKVRIDFTDGSTIPGTSVLAANTVWRSWGSGSYRGWASNRTAGRAQRTAGKRFRYLVEDQVTGRSQIEDSMTAARAVAKAQSVSTGHAIAIVAVRDGREHTQGAYYGRSWRLGSHHRDAR